MISYDDYLAGKLALHIPAGFETKQPVNPMLFPFQRDITRWSLELGQSAVFLECGLGKTPIQLEWAYHVAEHTNRPVLILAPLTVADQTVREGNKFGREVAYCRNQEQADKADAPIIITNYEMLSHFNPSAFGGSVLDESSILKNFTGVTKQAIINAFASTQFKLACTATPAPNDDLELGNHAEHLGIMRSNEMISRWFINDTMAAGSYRLKHHASDHFWEWLTSWAVCLSTPSDLGYSDEGYELPPIVEHTHVIPVDHRRAWGEQDKNGQGLLLLIGRTSATSMHKEKHATLEKRMEMAAEIGFSHMNEPVVFWVNYDYEADLLKKLLPHAIEVRGSQPREIKRQGLMDFADGHKLHLITKPEIAGLGMNWQHCGRQVFTSINHKFEMRYQCKRRSHRFGRVGQVDIHTILAESEFDIFSNLQRKETDHITMQHEMITAMKLHGLSLRTNKKAAVHRKHRVPMQLPAWAY